MAGSVAVGGDEEGWTGESVGLCLLSLWWTMAVTVIVHQTSMA